MCESNHSSCTGINVRATTLAATCLCILIPPTSSVCTDRIFFLVLDVEERKRKSWVVWYEGMRFPDLIIELLSDTTRAIDTGEKKVLYERTFRTQEYYLYDPFSQGFTGYHLQGIHYHAVQPDAEQKIYSVVTDLYLGVSNEWLRWLTAAGTIIQTPREWAEQEHQRAEQEHQKAEQARERAARAEQLLEAYQRRFGSLDAL